MSFCFVLSFFHYFLSLSPFPLICHYFLRDSLVNDPSFLALIPLAGMRILVNLLLDTLPMLGNVLLLCFFVFFIFGIIGVQLWAGLLRNRCFMDENLTMWVTARGFLCTLFSICETFLFPQVFLLLCLGCWGGGCLSAEPIRNWHHDPQRRDLSSHLSILLRSSDHTTGMMSWSAADCQWLRSPRVCTTSSHGCACPETKIKFKKCFNEQQSAADHNITPVLQAKWHHRIPDL